MRNLLFVGMNKRAIQYANELKKERELGYNIIGFVDEYNVQNNLCQNVYNDFKIVSNFKGFQKYIRNNVIDEVLICLPIKSFYNEIEDIIRLCAEQEIIIRILNDFFEIPDNHSNDRKLHDGTLNIYTKAQLNRTRNSYFLKRVIDLMFSIILILLLSPLLALISVGIKCTSNGPILYSQNRIGLNKRIFKMYKFRTMVEDAEIHQREVEYLNEADGPVFKIRNDPRITKIGKYLRRTSIDELPQLFNVLKGDMSLVGPRPLPERDFLGFQKDWHRRRFSVKPGMTCLWQISGRNDVPFEKWMEMDINYINRWSLWLDFKIMMKTIPSILGGHGAR